MGCAPHHAPLDWRPAARRGGAVGRRAAVVGACSYVQGAHGFFFDRCGTLYCRRRARCDGVAARAGLGARGTLSVNPTPARPTMNGAETRTESRDRRLYPAIKPILRTSSGIRVRNATPETWCGPSIISATANNAFPYPMRSEPVARATIDSSQASSASTRASAAAHHTVGLNQ